MRNIKQSIFAIFLLMSSVAFSQVYDDFDRNRDLTIDRNEFDQTYSDNYDQWDLNQDRVIDDREFYDVTYDRLDTNADSFLQGNEWDRGYDDIYGEYLGTRDYEQFDIDADDRISGDEFYTGMRESDLYNTYDINRDGIIEEDEMNEAVFTNWDRNRDDMIDRDEYSKFGSYYLDTEY